jgi:hypothetical protein
LTTATRMTPVHATGITFTPTETDKLEFLY